MSQRHRRRPGWFARWPFLLAMGLLALSVQGCALLPKEEVDEAPTLVEPPPEQTVTYKVERGHIAEEIRGLGRVAATNEAELYFTISARLKKLHVKTGDVVRRGDLLAELEIGDVEYQLKRARLDLELAQSRYERLKKMAQIEPVRYDADLKNAEVEVEKQKIQVDYLQDRYNASRIVAPFNGRVVSVRGMEGQVVKEYDTVIRLADPTNLQVQVEISNTSQLSRIVPGQKARVQIRRGQWVDATVFQVPAPGDELAPGQPDRRVRIRLNDPSIRLNFDDLVETVIVVREKDDALLVPNAAIREFFGRTFVRVMEGNARREVDVELGIRGQTHTEIVKGLNEGQIVIGR